MLDKVYVIPTYKCNLNCPHCELHKLKYKQDKEKFLEQLKNIEAREVILFGGEPLITESSYLERIFKTGKITSISSNLTIRTKMDLLVKYIKKYKISVSTSWNPQRFINNTIIDWCYGLYSISKVAKYKPLVLITLTEDLFNNKELYNILDGLEGLDGIPYISGVLFEHYIGPEATEEYHQKADNFLCKIYKEWHWKFNNFIIDKLDNWNCNCSNIKTLEPNGILRVGCPQYNGNIITRKECLECQFANICNPCYLQKSCSFPKKLYQLVKEEKDGSYTK